MPDCAGHGTFGFGLFDHARCHAASQRYAGAVWPQKAGQHFYRPPHKKRKCCCPNRFLQKMLYGQPSAFREIPVSSFRFDQDSVYVREYIGDEETAAETAFNIYKISDKNSIASAKTKKTMVKEASVAALRDEIVHHQLVRKTFWLGTDIYGRDMLSRLIIGFAHFAGRRFFSGAHQPVSWRSCWCGRRLLRRQDGCCFKLADECFVGFANFAAGDCHFFCFGQRFVADICGRWAFDVG